MAPKTSLLVLFAAGALMAAAPVLTPDVTLKDRDHKSMGKTIWEYFAAMKEKENILKSWDKVMNSFEKADKKLRKVNYLTLVEDWEQIFYQATAAGLSDRGLRKGKVVDREFEPAPGVSVPYVLSLPKSYSAKKGPFPLIIAIHSMGETPAEHLDRDWADANGRAGAILLAPVMPEDEGQWSTFDPTADGALDGITTLMYALKAATSTLAVDVNRTFLAARGSSAIGAALTTATAFPNIFAGVIARGEAPEADPTNFRGIDLLFVDGGEQADIFAKAVTDGGGARAESVTGKREAEIWTWLNATRRNAYPDHVTFLKGSTFNSQAYWVHVGDADVNENPLVDCRIEREANRIVIEAKNIATIRLSLNDRMVDMDSPVTVVINGTEQEIVPGRNLPLMVGLVYRRGDWGRVFTAEIPFDVPEEESK